MENLDVFEIFHDLNKDRTLLKGILSRLQDMSRAGANKKIDDLADAIANADRMFEAAADSYYEPCRKELRSIWPSSAS